MSTISLLSYNTHLFFNSIGGRISPGLIYDDNERFAAIIERIISATPAFDVVGLTEVWAHTTQDAVATALNGASFAFQGEPEIKAGDGMSLTVNGVFSRPVGFQYYENLVGPDALAAKGVVYGRAMLRGVEVLLVQTHTQASYVGSEAADQDARDQQIQQTLFSILDDHADFSGPVFLLGDLNIVAAEPEYTWLCRELAKRGLTDAWTHLSNPGPGYTYDPANNGLVQHFDPKQTQAQRLDYVFFNASRASLRGVTIPTDWKTATGVDLSDHYPVLSSFEI